VRVNRFDTPGFREAVERQSAIRDNAFLDAELPVNICGITIRHMIARDYLILDALGSPFIVGGRFPADFDAVEFLWHLQVRQPFSQLWFSYRCGKKFVGKPVLEQIMDYVKDTFQDAPGGGRGGAVADVGFLAAMVDTLASEYGWDESKVAGPPGVAIPLRRLFQYMKRIRLRTDPNAISFNPSDAIISRELRLKRERKKLLALLSKRAQQ